MKLTIYHDGQFYIGLIETVSANKLKAYRYVFGKEPKDQEVLDFVQKDLLSFIAVHSQKGITVKKEAQKKINPKKLQRKVSKEIKQKTISSQAQEAIKAEYEERKKEKVIKSKQQKEEQQQYKRAIKIQKAKNRHKGR
ncbi:YjdF family protein [Niallia sp. 01092]|uniref:YjdF family protein n=1 Tax=unclassified Niallia TaxID=2837522 RepID=UPI003FCF4EFB